MSPKRSDNGSSGALTYVRSIVVPSSDPPRSWPCPALTRHHRLPLSQQRFAKVHHVVGQGRQQRYARHLLDPPHQEAVQPTPGLQVSIDRLAGGGPFFIDLLGLRLAHALAPLDHKWSVAFLGLTGVHT